MNYKLILCACILLGITPATQANFKQNLKAACGGITTATGVWYTADFIKFHVNHRKFPTLFRDQIAPVLLLVVTASGYHMLNDGLNNKPNEAIKNLIQKAKARLQKPKVNE